MDNPNSYRQSNWSEESIGNYTSPESIKKRLTIGNICYLNRHPELRAIIRMFLHELINKQPENIYEFSAALFNLNNTPLLVTKINCELEKVKQNLKKNQWSQYDAEDIFSEKVSTHSLISKSSTIADIENILRYSMIFKDAI
ncbi:uncharacterized protein LOC142239604 [Haematobia irritans]|uniref:uncharacterized protein LOC142239604 n=1 Tax=Haematobia irritans TaxID=7368 RepID=UPI003F4FEF22